MGIIFMMFAVLLVAYALLIPRLLYFLCHLILIRWLDLAISTKLIWSLLCLALLLPALRFFYAMVVDAKGGTPDLSSIWKFFMILSVVIFGLTWLVGLKSK